MTMIISKTILGKLSNGPKETQKVNEWGGNRPAKW